jgi:hypothetical protein
VWRATPKPEPRFERFRLAYPSGTVVMAFYAGGVTLEEVQVRFGSVFWARA